jgi:hypothetical protein
MTVFKTVLTAAALFGLAGNAVAATTDAAGPCVSKAEIRAGLAYMIPTLVRGLKAKCEPVLGATSYMSQHGDDLVGRFQSAPSQNEDAVMSLLTKMSGPKPEGIDKAAFMEAFSSGIAAKMGPGIKPAACPKIDAAFAELDPLPAENMIGLIEIIATEALLGRNAKPMMPTLCPATGAR